MYRLCSKCNIRRERHEKICPTCHSRTDIELDLGDTLRIDSKREFGITRQLSSPGEAGMSAVYLAERIDDPNRYGAIKVAKLNKVEALKREAEVLQNLQKFHHPNIIRLVHPERAIWQDRKDDEVLHFFALEYMDSGSLKDRLQRENKLPLPQAVPIIQAVGQALECAHQNGFVHLDVKPANILFDSTGRIVLSDFGIARDASQLRELNKRVGTLFYNSPEQLNDSPLHSQKADIYALGVILYEMLVGSERFRQHRSSSSKSASKDDKPGGRPSTPIRPINGELPPPRQLEPAIPPMVEQVILKAITPAPEMRYDSVTEMLSDLSRAIPQPKGQSKTLILLTSMVGVLIALALIGLGIFFSLRPGGTLPPSSPSSSVITLTTEESPTAQMVIIQNSLPTATTTPAQQTSDFIQQSPTPIPTVTRGPSPTPTDAPRPVVRPPKPTLDGWIKLTAPDNEIQAAGGGRIMFQWQWFNAKNEVKGCDEELPEGYGFQVRIWPDHDDPFPPGAMDANLKPACDPGSGTRTFTIDNIKAAAGVNNAGSGRFRWDVVVIELDNAPPYPAIIQTDHYRLFFY